MKGVNLLFLALIVVVSGSLLGEMLRDRSGFLFAYFPLRSMASEMTWVISSKTKGLEIIRSIPHSFIFSR